MEIRVNPTRMELLRLKKRLQVARRGHKLLKDKFDEMMKIFLELIERNREIRQKVEEKLAAAYAGFALAKAVMSPRVLEESILAPGQGRGITPEMQKVFSITAPRFILSAEGKRGNGAQGRLPYSMITTSGELDRAVLLLKNSFEDMIELAEVEKTVELMAAELEKTRRRVNALEYVLIPQLAETIRFISMKLEENERGNLVRLMKVKEIVRAK
ncbi:MAG: V-type ATP synthase subunit D [Bacillota bacterium]